MIFAIAAACALLTDPSIPPPPAMSSEEAVMRASRSFDLMDINRDGFVDIEEAPNARLTRPSGEVARSGPAYWIELHDSDTDGRVSREEFITKMAPILWAGRSEFRTTSVQFSEAQ
jgi:hypothetical protein